MITVVWQVLWTLVILASSVAIAAFMGAAITSFGKKKGFGPTRYKVAVKVASGFVFFVGAVLILFVWGVSVNNFGVFLSSILGLVAIGFVAVWSILSNILSGLFLFVSDTFRFEDEITILPENIEGRVTDIKLMFVVLEDPDGNVLHVPNNVLIQKVIKRRKRTETATGEDEGAEE